MVYFALTMKQQSKREVKWYEIVYDKENKTYKSAH